MAPVARPAAKREKAAKAKATPAADVEMAAADESPTRGQMALDAKTTKALTERLKRRPAAKPLATPSAAAPTGVIYVGHLPHGFYEEQMRPFFEQFGTVTRLRVARSKKNARAKGYAFVEFAEPEVARIVADAMNGYLMFEKNLQVHVVAPADVHPATFKGANRPFKRIDFRKIAAEKANRSRSDDERAAQAKRLLAAEGRTKRKLAEAGIDYDFPGYAASAATTGGAAGGAAGKKRKAGAEPQVAAASAHPAAGGAAGGAAKKRATAESGEGAPASKDGASTKAVKGKAAAAKSAAPSTPAPAAPAAVTKQAAKPGSKRAAEADASAAIAKPATKPAVKAGAKRAVDPEESAPAKVAKGASAPAPSSGASAAKKARPASAAKGKK